MGAGGWDFPPEEWKKLDDASALPVEYPQDFQAWVEPLIHGDLGAPLGAGLPYPVVRQQWITRGRHAAPLHRGGRLRKWGTVRRFRL